MVPVVFTPTAHAELIDAQDWYENEVPGLGRRFRAEVGVVVQRMSANPRQFPVVYKSIHRALLRRFPYALMFVIETEDVDRYRLFPRQPRSGEMAKEGVSHGRGRRLRRFPGKLVFMRLPTLALAAIGALTVAASAQTPIDVQPVKEIKPTGKLSTCFYRPIAAEAPFFAKLSDKEKSNDPDFGGDYTIHGKTGTYVAWFGIVRGITPTAQAGGEVTLLVQHQFFDGMTDCHIMLVAKTGDGDFLARLKVDPAKIPALSLVRIYGKVAGETAGVPEVDVEYIRVWPWLTFTFTDIAGEDHSNPRWQKYSSVKPGDEIYVPYPNENYYLKVLGDPADFGVNLKPE